MHNKPDDDVTRFIPLLVAGIVLNALSVVFTGLGDIRFLMMGAGLILMLVFIVKAIASRAAARRDSR